MKHITRNHVALAVLVAGGTVGVALAINGAPRAAGGALFWTLLAAAEVAHDITGAMVESVESETEDD